MNELSGVPVVPSSVSYTFDGAQNRVVVSGGPDAGLYVRDDTISGPADWQVNPYTQTPFDRRKYDANGNLVRVEDGAGSRRLTYNNLEAITTRARGVGDCGDQ